jgi:hypothetical protein
MPAATFSALAAAVVATNGALAVDTDIGIRNGITGLLVNGVTFEGTREKNEKKNHRGVHVMSIYSNPQFAVKFDCEITVESATLVNRHPGEGLDRAAIAEFRTGTAGKWPIDRGFFVLEEPAQAARPMDLNTYTWTARLMCEYDSTIMQVTAATA